MRKTVIVIGVAMLVAGAVLASRHRGRGARRSAGALVVRPTSSATTIEDASPASSDRAMALAVASLTPEERRRAIEGMAYVAARLEARVSPFGTDFGDEEPMVELERAVAPYLPALKAARALERGRWSVAGLSVTAVVSCDALVLAPGETCVPLEGDDPRASDAGHELASRARFAAWPVAHAAIADLGTVSERDRTMRALRSRVAAEGSPIALVLGDEDLALRPVPERGDLEEAARHLGAAMEVNDLHDRNELEALGRSAPAGRVASWLSLSSSEILVVPRLSKLARHADLVAEIERAAGKAVPLRKTFHDSEIGRANSR